MQTNPGISGYLRELPLFIAAACLITTVFLKPVTLQRPVHFYQITFDISQSMNVRDVRIGNETSSRLELAKAAVQSMLLELPCGSQVGWSAFTGARIISLIKPMEICEHYHGLRASLDMIDGRMRWFNGSSIGKGLHQSLRAAKALGDNVSVVMITDGHEAPPLRPGQSGLPKSEHLGVTGILVGVGGNTAVPIPKTDRQGRISGYWRAEEVIQQPGVDSRYSYEELSRLKSEHLIKVAGLADFEYLHLQTPDALTATLKKAGLGHRAEAPVDLRWIPAVIALLCIGWRFLPPLRFARREKHLASHTARQRN